MDGFWFWMQMGVISPTKLRMKLLGSAHNDESTRKSPRASPPSRLDDDDHPNNSLLPQELDDEGALLPLKTLTRRVKIPSFSSFATSHALL